MKKLLLIIGLLFVSTFAQAQAPTKLCVTTTGSNCIQIENTFALPVGGTANATAPTRTEAQIGVPLSFDLSSNLRTSTIILPPTPSVNSGLTAVSSTALAANTVIKASAGNLYSFEVSATPTLYAASWWIMIYNATAAPSDGAVTPLKCYAMPAGATSAAYAFPTPIYFSTGITIGVSTTGCFTKTASTQAFISGDAK